MSRPLSRRSKKKGKNCDYGKDSDCEDDDDEEELENDNHPVEEVDIFFLFNINDHMDTLLITWQKLSNIINESVHKFSNVHRFGH